MAYCKVFTSHNAGGALHYGEHEKDVERGGVNCPDDTKTAMMLFKADRIMWDKTDGIQAHILVQSFDENISKEEANRIGKETAEKFAPGHRAMVYTHNQGKGGKVHNHIVIESVNPENGKKLETSGELYKARELSDEICLEHGLSIIDREHSRQDERRTMAERALIEKGEKPWKEEMREKVQEAFNNSHDIESFKEELKRAGIAVSERMRTYQDKTKDLDFTYQDQDGHKCRAYKLGDDFTRRDVCRAFEMEKAQEQEQEKQFSQTKMQEKPLERLTEKLNDMRESRFNQLSERLDNLQGRENAKKAALCMESAKKNLDVKLLAKAPADLASKAIENSFKLVQVAAKLGNQEAQAMLQNYGASEKEFCDRWDLLTQQKKDEIRSKNAYRDDYGDEGKSLMTGYKPKVRVRTKEDEMDYSLGR